MSLPSEEQLVQEKLSGDTGDLGAFADEMERADTAAPRRLKVDPEKTAAGLAKLVLTVVELLRQVMEHQAVRRIEAGSLTDDQIEELGNTFLSLDERMAELKITFGIEDEELNLNLGPLGDLM